MIIHHLQQKEYFGSVMVKITAKIYVAFLFFSYFGFQFLKKLRSIHSLIFI